MEQVRCEIISLQSIFRKVRVHEPFHHCRVDTMRFIGSTGLPTSFFWLYGGTKMEVGIFPQYIVEIFNFDFENHIFYDKAKIV